MTKQAPRERRMTVRELNIGDVFRVAGEAQLWRKAGPTVCRQTGPLLPGHWWHRTAFPGEFTGKAVEVVERAPPGDIRRAGGTLVLRGGEVTLEYHGAWGVFRCTPGDPRTEFALTGASIGVSVQKTPTADAALAFAVGAGGKHLGRPKGSDVFAYAGRVYARATKREVTGPGVGSYKLIRKIDGKPRVVIAGLLCLPGESALYDIIMEHFGPDAAPPPPR